MPTSNEHGDNRFQRHRDLADVAIAEAMHHAMTDEMRVYPTMEEHLPKTECPVYGALITSLRNIALLIGGVASIRENRDI